MAAAAAAALLDELMGRNRNVGPNEKKVELNWEDAEFCKLYMVKFCPHDLFVNTRADLGACSKIHDEEVKKLYDDADKYKKLPYIEDFMRYCHNILNDVAKRIEKGEQRLELMNSTESLSLTPAQIQKNQEQIALLSEKINKLVEEAEAAGIEGNVEQAQGLMKLCDQLKDERNTLRKQIDNSQFQQTAHLASEQEKQMEVCQVCGAFLIVNDAQQRIDDHLMGKQHVGYSKLKEAVAELTKLRDEIKSEVERKRESERRDRDRLNGTRDRSRDRRRSRERHSRVEVRRSSGRDREREREHERRGERHRDRNGRDRRDRYREREEKGLDRHGKDEKRRSRYGAEAMRHH